MDELIKSVVQALLTREGVLVTAVSLAWAFERWQHVKRDKIEIARVERWAMILEGYNKDRK